MSAGRAAVQRAVLPLLSQFLKPVQLGSLLLHQLIMPTSGSLPRIGHLFHFLVLPGRWPRAPAGPRPAVQGAPHRSNSRNCRSPPNTWTFSQYIQTWTRPGRGPSPSSRTPQPTRTGSGGRCPLPDTSPTIAQIRISPSGPPNLTTFSRAVQL